MPRRRKEVPSYRLHKQSGQAIVTINTGSRRRDVLLGPYNSPESRREYNRILGQLEAAAPAVVATRVGKNPTLNEVMVGYLAHAEVYYRAPAGKRSSEVHNLRYALRVCRETCGEYPAAEFGPGWFRRVRDAMVGKGWSRPFVNKQAGLVKRMVRWSVENELVPADSWDRLRAVPPLKKGRTTAPEPPPVLPVDDADVQAALPFLTRHTRTMVELARLTGMRPGEVCGLTAAELDRSGDVWVYRPARHKTAHRGKPRAIPFGPRARALLVGFLVHDAPPPAGWADLDLTNPVVRLNAAAAYEAAGRPEDAKLLRAAGRPVVAVGGCVVDPDAAVFSPARDREERARVRRAARRSRVQPSQLDRRKPDPKRVPAAAYTPHALAVAVSRACERAGVAHWHPNQLRHTFATEVRKTHGIEAAQVLLGHAKADTTQVYAERDEALAARVAAAIG